MVNFVTSINETDTFLGGITFVNTSVAGFTYKIRLRYSPRAANNSPTSLKQDLDWKTNFIYSIIPILGPREKDLKDGGDPGKL